MWTLGFDSTAAALSVAILKDGSLAASYNKIALNTHSTSLLPAIASLLEKLRLTINDINLISCSAGPGSFTGVRIGIATAKGLGMATGIPCIGVSSLEALASSSDRLQGVICPVIGARRGNVYSALFRCSSNNVVDRLTDDKIIAISELPELCKQTGTKMITVIGDAAKEVGDSLKNNGINIIPLPCNIVIESGYGAALAGYKAFLSKVYTSTELSASMLKPVYLRKAQAEREREERLSKKLL